MSCGPVQKYAVTMTTDVTLSTAVPIGKAMTFVYLDIPTMTSNTDIYIQGAASESDTYRRVMHYPINTSSVQCNTFVIGSAVSQRMVPIPAFFKTVKIEYSSAISQTITFNLICSD